jgi:hypothetical protein
VQVLQCAMNENASMLVPQFIQQFHPNHPVGWAPLDQILSYLQLSIMNVGFVPKMVFIDKKGVIQVQQEAGNGNSFFEGDQAAHIGQVLDKLLKAPVAASAHRKTAHKGK